MTLILVAVITGVATILAAIITTVRKEASKIGHDRRDEHESTKLLLRSIVDKVDRLDVKADRLDVKVMAIDAHVSTLDRRLNKLDDRLDNHVRDHPWIPPSDRPITVA